MANEEDKKDVTRLPINDIDVSFWKLVFGKYLIYTIVFLILSFILMYFFPSELSISLIFIVGGMSGGILYFKTKSQFTKEFGKSIGFTYSQTAPMDSVSGGLFSIGDNKKILDVLSGTHENIPIRIFTYFFQESGNDSNKIFLTVFEATLRGNIPNIFLCSKKGRVFDYEWGDDSVPIVLEGDFNKYFYLRVLKDYEQEAYQILTPDVMVSLIDMAHELNFEFVGNKLYIYKTELITKKSEMERIFNLSRYLIRLFHKNTANIKI